ncbi:MAG: N-acetylmuramoyl-L-alanine amidase [Solirubrobacterales bacterium]|nr:MAG: N-acetylmuramoyl-L-alanine amidase [Solirubrobacterales bacterium]
MRPSRAVLLGLTLATSLTVGAAAGEAGGDTQAAATAKQPRPGIEFDPIPYGHARKRQMAGYSERHYGRRAWRLNRRQMRAIVLHYTAGPSYGSAWSTFASNAPALGERPGVCAQFVVDKDGTIYQLTRLTVRCRHAIGINNRSLGVEMVQEDLGSSTATAQAILARRTQANAAVRLVSWLKQRYRVRMRNVIGHAMVNDSPLFEDLAGWRNDHSDWLPKPVHKFRKRLNRHLHGRGPAGPDAKARGTTG